MNLANDLLWTAKGIGQHLGLSERQAMHLLESHAIPATKVGAKWCASKSALDKFFQAATASQGDDRSPSP